MPSLRTGLPLFAVLFAAAIVAAQTPTSNQKAHAQVTGSVAIGCEFLIGAIDGDTTDAVIAADTTAACTGGLSAAEIDALAGDADHDNVAGETGENGLGDNDGKLEASDLAGIDLDGNQITDGGPAPKDSIYAIAFVNNDGTVVFDSQVGLSVAINADGTAKDDPAAPADDANSETCGAAEGLDDDCGITILSNGDGVVVATLTEASTAGATINVDISQGSDVSTQTIWVVAAGATPTPLPTATPAPPGPPANMALTASPAAIACDGSHSSTVTATVTDADGNNVADGTNVNFAVVALGTANPINVDTVTGAASSTITPLSGATAGVTVIVTSGDAQASIRVDCMLPPNPDFFSQAIIIPSAPYSDTRSNAGMTTEAGEPSPCAPVGATIWYQFTVPPTVSGLSLIADTTGSSFDTVLAVYSASFGMSPPGALSLLDCNDDTGGPQSTVAFVGLSSETYYFQAGGKSGATGTLALHLTCFGDLDCDGVSNGADADDDNDGCTDAQEIGPNPLFGGDRDPLNPWDFYDVDGTKSITLSDTLLILEHFGHAHNGDTVDPSLDRYVPDLLKPWRSAEALNGITLADALANLLSFGHSCTAPP